MPTAASQLRPPPRRGTRAEKLQGTVDNMGEHGPVRVYIETYGCQMNVLDSELIEDRLRAAGFAIVGGEESADVVLINTCSVRELAEHKVWSQLGRLGVLKREERSGLVVGVLGCMAEREGHGIVTRMPHVNVVCGPSSLDALPALLEDSLRGRGPSVEIAGHGSRRGGERAAAGDELDALDRDRSLARERAQAFVRITRGCNKLCAFCVVPFTRGPEAHRSPERIVEEVRLLTGAGVKEVTLLGQTVNHYHHQEGGRTTSFAELLWMVHEAVPQLPRLRFVTSFPRDFDDATLDVMAAAPRICRYLHLPAQSGSDRVLQLMNRGYTVAQYLGLLERARARMPDICLAGDMIAGFPTETEADHQASLELLRRARYKSCFVFKYSPRPGTVAARRLADDVPEEVKRRRNLELLDLQAQLARDHYRAKVGAELEVIVESHSKLRSHAEGEVVQIGRRPPAGSVRLVGRTRGDEIVAFDGPASLVGELCMVRAVDATALTILGELVARSS